MMHVCCLFTVDFLRITRVVSEKNAPVLNSRGHQTQAPLQMTHEIFFNQETQLRSSALRFQRILFLIG